MAVIDKFYEVKQLKFHIKMLDEKINTLRSKVEVQAVKYSDLPKIKNCQDRILSLRMEKLFELEMQKDKLQTKIDIILEELEVLPEHLYGVLHYRIIEGLKWKAISKKLSYSVSQCHRFFDIAKNFNI